MGKVIVQKAKTDYTKLGTKVKRESSLKKNVCRGHRKRLLMLRRRVSMLLDERESWEAKNHELVNQINLEKKLNSELRKDVFNWQQLYHEAIISHNALKVKNSVITQTINSCWRDFKGETLPQLVALSGAMLRNKDTLFSLLNASRELQTENNFPRAFVDCRQATSDLSKSNEKRMKHKVGPMVNGILIQKPTIRLERVRLHQPQGQEPSNNDLTPERGNPLTPIVEENEEETDSHLEQISVRRRYKCRRLGKPERWRMMKQQEKLEKERQMERERERENQRHAVSESSDSEDQLGLGPVIRLQRVSGLLLSPKLLEVDRGRVSEGMGATSQASVPDNRRSTSGEDPQEGCSWMHVSSGHSKKSSCKRTPRKSESSASSDSSDEEESRLANVVEKVRNSLSQDILAYKNKTYSMKRKDSSSSSTGDTPREASDTSRAEPDSTNNITDVVFAGTSTSDSLNMNTNSTVPDARVEITRTLEVGGGDCRTSIASVTARQSQDQRRSSSFCNNCTPITSTPIDMQEKRVRKPKVHLYPGEETWNSVAPAAPVAKKRGRPVFTSGKATSSKEKVSDRLSAGRKSMGERSLKNSSESSSVSGVPCQRPSEVRPSVSGQKLKTVGRPKKSSIKETSTNVSGTSVNQRLSQDQEESEGRHSRRNRGPITYKELPLKKKLRRPQ